MSGRLMFWNSMFSLLIVSAWVMPMTLVWAQAKKSEGQNPTGIPMGERSSRPQDVERISKDQNSQGGAPTQPKIPEKYIVRVGPYDGENAGVDTAMYRTIHVEFANSGHKDEQIYHVHYYLNDRLEGKIDATLPFSIHRNFQGQRPGFYRFRVQLWTKDLTFLAESSTEFVLPRKKP